MTISEGMVLRKNLKIRLPQVRSTIDLTEPESNKGLGQRFCSAVKGHYQRTSGHPCSDRLTGSMNSYGCNQHSLLKCESGSTAPGKGRRTSEGISADCSSGQLKMLIAGEPEVESVFAPAVKHESSMRLDGRKVKKQRINITAMDPLNRASLHSTNNCKEKGCPEINKWEKSGGEFVLAHIDKSGPLRALDGQKGKKRDTDSNLIKLLKFGGGPAPTSCKGKRISVMDNLQKIRDDCSGHTKLVPVDKFEEETVVACVGELGPVKRFDGHKGKRRIMDNGALQECREILKRLMTHSFGWVFNEPVDPVKLKIPDYFCIISEPMDLGTIKYKLEKKLYLDAKAFASDVRLTFSNAVRYNPPANDIHIMASKLNKIFESQWKSLHEKGDLESSWVGQKPNSKVRFKESRNLRRDGPKEDAGSCLNLLPSISSTVKNNLRKDLIEISKGKISSDLLDCLRRFDLIGKHEERIQVDIDAIDDKKLSEWHKVLRQYLDSKSTQSVPVKNHSGRGSIQKDPHNGTESGNKYACDNKVTLTSQCSSKNKFTQVISDSDRSSRKGKYARLGGLHNLDPLANDNDGMQTSKLDHISDGVVSVIDDGNVHCDRPTSPVTAIACEEGLDAIDYDGQMSPEKALRAAMLKRRFADTIVRAKQNTLLCNGEKGDYVKMQREKERLEKKQQEAKIRVATEAALRKYREAELRMQREREREAARIVLEKMEKTVEIYENQEILKDIEVFGGSIAYPLERLGLSLKAEFTEEDEDVVIDLNGDREEGEIF